jgi:pilus assembly protein CpaC
MILHALQQKGFVNVLARPNLICVDGKEASFLAGGEIPVPVAQTSSGGGTTVTIEWREFGTRLNFMPTIVDSNLIHLRVEPEVSILDYTNAVLIGGYVVPSLRTRRAETEVELRENESFVIGGLQTQSERKIEDKVPIIGDIPLLGYLFRSVSNQMETSELMIVVSPQIVRPIKTNEVPEFPCKELPPLPCTDKKG